jgi:hypothetical protein
MPLSNVHGPLPSSMTSILRHYRVQVYYNTMLSCSNSFTNYSTVIGSKQTAVQMVLVNNGSHHTIFGFKMSTGNWSTYQDY